MTRYDAIDVCLPIDQVVIGWRWRSVSQHLGLNDVEVFFVIPVAESDGANIYVIACIFRSINNHSCFSSVGVTQLDIGCRLTSSDACRILGGIVAVVPRGPVQACLESVGEAFTRRYRALTDTRYPIIIWSLLLKQSISLSIFTKK